MICDRNKRDALLASSAFLAVTALGCGTAAAQENTDPDNSELRAEKVIVTATRREEDAQTVPVAVSAFSSSQIEDSLIRDTNGLQQIASSLVVTVSNSETTGGVIRIRGVGTAGQNPGLEGAVGAFVDGVYRSRPGLVLNDLLDVKQVEVLRGPQGTLFGKNTSAGAIVITTNEPEFEWGGQALFGIGGDGQERYMGVLTGPILKDLLAFRLSGIVNKRDGIVTDVNTGEKYNNRDRLSLRAQLMAKPAEDVSLRMIVDYIDKDEVCCAAPYVVNGVRAPLIANLGGTVFNPTREDDLVVALNTAPQSKVEEFGISGHLDWKLDFGTLKVIASTRSFLATRNSDVDGSDLDLANQLNEQTKDRLDSLEATLQGTNGRLDWLVGAYAFQTKFNNPQSQVMGAELGTYIQGFYPRPVAALYQAGDGDLLRRFYQDGNGWSLFTHNTFSLTDKLKATLGVRYLEEDKDGGGQFVIQEAASCTSPLVVAALRIFCAVPDYQTNFKDDALTYTAALSYQLTPDVMGYVSYSKGYKAGGINLNRNAGQLTSQTFLPEESDNYEVGIKTQWLDERVLVNLTGFRLKFTDYQRNVFTGTETLLSNQGEVVSQGVELETRFRPFEGLDLNASTTFADTQYGDDINDASLAGRQLNSAPKWTAQVGGSYEKAINGNMSFFASTNARYQSSVVTGGDLDPLKGQDDYTIVDGRLGLKFVEQDAQIALWGTNLTDERYRVITFNSTLQAGSLQAYMGDPRAWGIEISKRY